MALKEILAKFDLQVDEKKLADVDKRIGGLVGGLKGLLPLAAGIGAALAPLALFRFSLATAGAVDEQAKLAQALSVSTRELAQWESVAQDYGSSVGEMRGGLQSFTKQLGVADAGNKKARESLKLLGVSARDAQGNVRPLADRLEDAVLGLQRIENPARRGAIAMQIFGPAGATMIRVSEDGAGALASLRREFDELNPEYERTVKMSQEVAATMDGWRKATDALRMRLASALLPAVSRIVTLATRAADAIARATAGTRFFEVALASLATVAAAVAIKLLAPFAPIIGIFALIAGAVFAVVLVLEDLYQLVTGGESAIAQLLDDLLGVGTAQAVVEALRAAFGFLYDLLRDLIVVARHLLRAWMPILRALARTGFRLLQVAAQLVAGAIRILIALGPIFRRVWETAVNVLARVFELLATVLGAIRDAIVAVLDRISSFLERISSGVRSAADAIRSGLEAAMSAVRAVVDATIGRIERLLQRAADAAKRVRNLFGGPDAMASFELELDDARSARPSAGGGVSRESADPRIRALEAAGVRIESPTTINVQGVTEPRAVAREVERVLDEREQGNLRRLREEFATGR